MRLPRLVDRMLQQDAINFALTNWVPRRSLTHFIGWFSRIEHPVIRDLSIGIMKLFAGDLSLHEARRASFRSLHDCFTRELKPGARPVDTSPGAIVSPCDAIVGACGAVDGNRLIQAKGRSYTLEELLGDARIVGRYRQGQFVTLRLTSNMYHRFHAPYAMQIDRVTYVPGDLFNVNPPALKRVERLYCRNERAAIQGRLEGSGESIAVVAVGAILVGSIHLNFANVGRGLRRKRVQHLQVRMSFCKGDELGYFQHGSTIIVVTSAGITRDERICQGARVRMGERLLRHAATRGVKLADS